MYHNENELGDEDISESESEFENDLDENEVHTEANKFQQPIQKYVQILLITIFLRITESNNGK